MNRRLLPFAFAFAPAVLAYACSSSDDGGGGTDTDAGTTETGPGADTSTNDDGAVTDAAKKDTSAPSNNPLEGLGPVTAVANINFPVEGPQWVTDSIYVSNLNKAVIKFTPSMPLVATGGAGDNPIEHYLSTNAGAVSTLGNAIDDSIKSPTPTLLTLEVNNGAPGASVIRTPFTGAFPRTGTALTVVADGGGAPTFDSPNDLIVRKTDGTIYMTDPAYQSTGVTTNHIWRLKPTAVGTDYDVIEIQLAGQPNGIALSPDNKTLYVSLTGPAGGPPPPTPRIEKYAVAADGSLGPATKFADVPPAPAAGMPETGSLADGLAVDSAGNVYVAVKNGVDVFKPDGLSKWGHITTTTIANGVAFGEADKKTLYITTQGGLFKTVVKVAGLGN